MRIIVALLTLALLLIATAAPGPSTEAQDFAARLPYYLSCPCTRDNLTIALIKNALTGRTAGVLLFKPSYGIYVVENNLPPDVKILTASLANNTLLTVAHDSANGTIMIFETILSEPIQLADTITNSSTRVITIKIKNGFITKAYARGHEKRLSILTNTVFIENNKTINNIVIIKVEIDKIVSVEARGQPIDSEVLSLEGSETCMPVLVKVTNNSLDIAPLMGMKEMGATLYHVPFKALPRLDTVSIIAQPRITGALVVSHPVNATSKILMIDLDAHKSKAYVYISDPLPGIASFEPKVIQRVNDTTYTVYGLGLTPQANAIPILALVSMSLNPSATIYYFDRIMIAPIDAGKVLVLAGSNVSIASLSSIENLSTRKFTIRMERSVVGLTMEPFRLIKEYSIYMNIETIKESNVTNTASTMFSSGTSGGEASPSPGQTTTNNSSKIDKKIILTVIILIIALGLFVAYRYLRERRMGEETIGGAVFRV